jgi:hypothetical protein
VTARGTRTRLEQRLGWLLVVLAALVWPSALLHDATTAHAVCPEHGELLDVGAHDPSADEDPHEGSRLAAAGESGGEHELCPFVTLGQPAALPVDVPPGEGLVAEPVVLVRIGGEQRFQSIPILCLAPKQSPPL